MMPPKVLLYSSSFCSYCSAAKSLLRDKGVEFEEINLDLRPLEVAERIAQLTGQTTVPQVFIGERHVGGYTDLKAANDRGDLDGWLAGVE
jgi:glutaredoxin 3